MTAPYSPDHERSARYDDPEIAIDWPSIGSELQLSQKDEAAPLLASAETFA